MAFDKKPVAPPRPMPATAKSATTRPASSAAPRVIQKRKFGLRGGIVLFLSLCFLSGAIVMTFGVSAMKDRGLPQDDILAAMMIGGGLALIGMLMFMLALKVRRTRYYDADGTPVAKEGSALPFIAMAQSLGDCDDADDSFDGDFD